jgi:hypothetical protein
MTDQPGLSDDALRRLLTAGASAVDDGPPPWLSTALYDILIGAYRAHVDPDRVVAQQTVRDLWITFDGILEGADLGPDEMEACFDACVLTLAATATALGPPEWRSTDDAIVALSVVDTRTGATVDDPDHYDGSPEARGMLAAHRILTALGNGDPDTAIAVLDAIPGGSTLACALITVTHTAGYAMDYALKASPHPMVAAGLTWQPLTPQEQTRFDRGCAHIIGVYIPDACTLEQAADAGHDHIAELNAGWSLCGVRHAETIDVWQTPVEARAGLRQRLRQLEKLTGHRAGLYRAWQHTTACPDAPTQES